MKKRFLSILLTLCMVTQLMPTGAFAAQETDAGGSSTGDAYTVADDSDLGDAEGQDDDGNENDAVVETGNGSGEVALASTEGAHVHRICGDSSCTDDSHAEIEWTAWNSNTSLPSASGSYYLTTDVTLSNTWNVWKSTDIKLCLNGHAIIGADGKEAIIVRRAEESITNLDITDCHEGDEVGKITHNKGAKGRAIENFGTLTLWKGNITGNTGSNFSSGVAVNNYYEFNMCGGTIAGNDGSWYGTVYNEATFNMSAGSITNNLMYSGGGVYNKGGAFNMSGGSITNNVCTWCAAGVYNAGSLNLSGNVTIADNTDKDGRANNLYLYGGYYLKTNGELAATSSVGITAENPGDNPVVIGSTTATTGFFSDDETYGLMADEASNVVKLVDALTIPQEHKICGDAACQDQDHATLKWKAVKSLDQITADGNYYLLSDVNLDDTWTCDYNVNLCLNGKTIAGGSGKDVIEVAEGKALAITDCQEAAGKITHTEGRKGRGVLVNGGTLTLWNGSIADNSYGGSNGGGVAIFNDGTFDMRGGSITGNSAPYEGAGIYNRGTFTMSGGSITGNSAAYGGGVANYATFTMSGGSITGNTATEKGAGVYSWRTLTMSGNAAIKDNTVSGAANNVFLATGQKIAVATDGMGTGASVGITSTNPSASPTVVTGTTQATGFFSDNTNYELTPDGNDGLKLSIKPFDTSGVKLLVSNGGAEMTEDQAGARSKVYDGQAVAYDDSAVAAEPNTATDVTLTYTWQVKNGEEYANIDGNAAPSDVGSYRLLVTAQRGNAVVGTSELPFTITAKKLTIELPYIWSKTYDGTDTARVSGYTTSGICDRDDSKVNLELISASFADKNVGADKDVTLKFELTGERAFNYTIDPEVKDKASITAKELTVTGATVAKKTYDGTADAEVTAVSFDGLVEGESLALGTDYTVTGAAFDSADVASATKVGFSVKLAETSAAKNYVLKDAKGSQPASIKKAAATGYAVSDSRKAGEQGGCRVYVVPGGSAAVSVEDEGGIIDGADIVAGFLTYKLKDSATEGKTAIVTAKVTSANYEDYEISVTVKVSDKEQVEIGLTGDGFTYSGKAQAPAASVEGNKVEADDLDVTYYDESGQESTEAPAKAGTYLMVVSVPDDNAEYTGFAMGTFQIEPKALTATAKAEDKEYDGTDEAEASVELSGAVAGDGVTATVTGASFGGKNVGAGKDVTVTFELSGKDAANYTAPTTAKAKASITAKQLTVTALAADKIYDGGTGAQASVELTGAVDGDDVAAAVTSASFVNKNAGADKDVTVSVALSGADAGNYTAASTAKTTASIVARWIIIAGATVSEKTYDGTTDANITAVTFDGLVEGESLALGTDYTVTGAEYDGADATGDGAATKVDFSVKLGETSAAKNYVLKDTEGSQPASIKKAATTGYAVTDARKAGEQGGCRVYVVPGGSAAVSVEDEGGIIDGADIVAGFLTYKLKDSATEGKTAIVTAKVTSANYEDYEISVTVKVSDKEQVEIGLTGDGFTYSGKAQAPAASVEGNKVEADDLDVTYYDESGQESTEAPAKAGTYLMVVSVPDTNPGYTGFAMCAFQIKPKTLTAVALAQSKTYDGTAVAEVTGVSLEGRVDGDEVVAQAISGSFDDKNIGTDKDVTVAFELVGKDAGNYTADAMLQTKASITAKELGVTAATEDKTYDGTTDANATAALTGVVAGDDVTASVTSASFADKNAGTGKDVMVAFGLGGADAGNYTAVELVKTTASIVARRISIAGATVSDKTYDGTTAATVTDVSFDGLVDGESLTFGTDYGVSGARYDGANATGDGAATKVGFSVALANTAAAKNYALTSAAGEQAATIAKVKTSGYAATDSSKPGEQGSCWFYVVPGGAASVSVEDEGGILDGDPTVAGNTLSYKLKDSAAEGQTATVKAKVTSANYEDYEVSVTVEVSDKEQVSIDLAGDEFTYDGSAQAPAITVDGNKVEVSDLDVTYYDESGNESSEAPKAAGTYLMLVSVPDSNNSYTGFAACTFRIAKKNVRVEGLAVADKPYDGTTAATISGTPGIDGAVAGDDVSLVSGVPTFSSAAVGESIKVVFTDFSLTGAAAGNYELTQPSGVTASITAYAAAGSEYTATTGEWTSEDFTVTAADGWKVALSDAADADWRDALTCSDEGEGSLAFYVRNDAQGYISQAVTLPYKIDKTAPTGKVEVGKDFWTKFVETVTFGLYRNDKQAVTISGDDALSGVASIEYLVSSEDLGVDQLADRELAAYEGAFDIEPDASLIVYARVTDKAGNVTYLRSDGVVLDATAPVISGAQDGRTYCAAVELAVSDANLDTVTLNGAAVALADGKLAVRPAAGEQTVTATDKAGNSTTLTLTVNDGHTWGAWKSNGDGTHTRACKYDVAHTETADCHGGTATCVDRAVCDDCGHEYGEVDPSSHASLTHVEAKEATTSAEGNTEYWYCAACGKYFSDAAGEHEIQKSDTVVPKKPENPDDKKDDSDSDGKDDSDKKDDEDKKDDDKDDSDSDDKKDDDSDKKDDGKDDSDKKDDSDSDDKDDDSDKKDDDKDDSDDKKDDDSDKEDDSDSDDKKDDSDSDGKDDSDDKKDDSDSDDSTDGKSDDDKSDDDKSDGEKPNTPDTPDASGVAEKPAANSPAKPKVPQTGDAAAAAALPALLGTATVAAALVSARKKRDE